MMKTTTLTLLTSLATTAAASAQIITAYDVSGSGTTNAALAPTTTVATVTATSLTRGAGLTFASAVNSFNSNNWNITNTLDTTTATGKYLEFDVTAGVAGVTLSTLQFAINGSGTAPNTGQWGYSLDGGTTFTLGTTANGGMFTTAAAQPTAQSTWDFTDFTLAANATVDFRFFEYGATSISGATAAAGGTTRIANITGVGNPQYDLVLGGPLPFVQPVNAPEPSSLAFIVAAAGLLGVGIYRRNRMACTDACLLFPSSNAHRRMRPRRPRTFTHNPTLHGPNPT